MTNQKFIDTYYQLGRLSTEALEEDQHHKAFGYAVAAYLMASESDSHMKDNILVMVWKICESFVFLKNKDAVNNARERRQEEKACSFCGKKEPEVKLVPGLDWVFVCNSCVNDFYSMFREKE